MAVLKDLRRGICIPFCFAHSCLKTQETAGQVIVKLSAEEQAPRAG
jgi:hypothetical protein